VILACGPQPPDDNAARIVAFGLPGAVTLSILVASAVTLLRRGGGGMMRANDRFLAAWWLIETTAALVVSPWPAARRVIVPLVVGTLLLGRLAARNIPTPRRRRLVGFAAGFGVALGLFVQAIDIDNAGAERTAVEQATEWVRQRDANGPIFFTGHWGLQFYAERAGWRPVNPDHTRLPKDSWLVIPRREDGRQQMDGPGQTVIAHRVAVSSPWPLATLPWLHGGNAPLRRQVDPIVVLSIYRVTGEYVPQTPDGGGMPGP
jgi:hypothetical protein